MSPWFRLDTTVADRLRELGPAAAMVVIRLGRHADGDGVSWPSIAQLAAMTGLAERTVRRAIRRLVDAGLLEVQPRTGHAGVSASNLYRLVFTPQDQADARDALPCHAGRGEGGCRDTVTLSRETDELEPFELEPLNKKRAPAPAGSPPGGLLEVIDAWNAFGPSIVGEGNGARRDPPAQEVVRGWNRAQKHADQRAALTDLPRLVEAIRAAGFCHAQPWFTLAWLFGRNRNGELNIIRLLAGAYNQEGGTRHGRNDHPAARKTYTPI